MRFPLFGTDLVRATLSMPLMLFAPGLWATLEPLIRDVNISVSWSPDHDPQDSSSFDHGPVENRPAAMLDVSRKYIGSVSALNWTDRARVLDFFAAQDFLLKEVSRTLKEGLYCGGSLVVYRPKLLLPPIMSLTRYDAELASRGQCMMNVTSIVVLVVLTRNSQLMLGCALYLTVYRRGQKPKRRSAAH
jgi:hypothetical protein